MEDLIDMEAVLYELLAQDPCCYYRMVDACLRRHGSEGDLSGLVGDAILFMHPSGASRGSRKEFSEPAAAAAALPCSDCTHGNERDQVEAETNASSSTSSRGGADGPRVLGNWKQTQAFLSALLSYNKVLRAYRASMPVAFVQGLREVLTWFRKEGVLDVLENASLGLQGQGSSSSSREGSGGGGCGYPGSSSVLDGGAAPSSGDPAGHSRRGTTDAPTCLPEELAACCMLALAVVARVAVTNSEMLGEPDLCESSDNCSSNGGRPSDRIDLGGGSGNMKAGLLGVVCYCMLKQLQRDGSINGSSSSGGESNSGTGDNVGGVATAGAGTLRAQGSSAGRSSSSRGVHALSAAATAASQKWGGLQLQLPAPLLLKLQEFEAKVQGSFWPEWAQVIQQCRDGAQRSTDFFRLLSLLKGAGMKIMPVTTSGGRKAFELVTDSAEEHDQLEQVEGQELQQGQEEEEEPEGDDEEHPLSHAMVGLLRLVLGLCEEVMQQVQVPLGCNDPSCTNLGGLSEASAAKVCTDVARCITVAWSASRRTGRSTCLSASRIRDKCMCDQG